MYNIYIYIYTYIHIYKYDEKKSSKTLSYIQNCVQNLIEVFKITVYNIKNTQKHQTTFSEIHFFKHRYFPPK